uniref:Uncharacterized protein n=1 Tax=Bionectria ochroleuca TaxID=29856 RepID=A0A8H7N074_BIOOC
MIPRNLPLDDMGENAAQHQEMVTAIEAANDADYASSPEPPTESDTETSSTLNKAHLDLSARSEARPSRASALKEVLGMLPDELHMRELLRPLEASGKGMTDARARPADAAVQEILRCVGRFPPGGG